LKIPKIALLVLQKFPNFARGRSIQKEQLSVLPQLQILSGFEVTSSGNYSNLYLP
jgi:hypothetical protein